LWSASFVARQGGIKFVRPDRQAFSAGRPSEQAHSDKEISIGRDVTHIINANRKSLPRGSFLTLRGQLPTM
jgi:hypothetical protein